MTARLFTNVMIFDATGRAPFPGEVLVQGNRIQKVAEGPRQIAREAAGEVIDGQGMTLMPGMTEGHCHISRSSASRSRPSSARCRPRSTRSATMHNAQAAARPRLHQRLLRGLGQAAARRGDPQRDQRRAHPGPADPRRQPRDHRDRGPRRRAQAAPAPRELRPDRRRRRRDAPGLPDLRPRGRRQPQDQHLGRRVRQPLQGRDDRDDGRRDRDRGRRRARLRQADRLPRPRRQLGQARGPPRRRRDLPLRLRRRGGARHARERQGQDLRRPGGRPAAQHAATRPRPSA